MVLMVLWYFSPHGFVQEKTSFVLCGHILNPSGNHSLDTQVEWSEGVSASGPDPLHP